MLEFGGLLVGGSVLLVAILGPVFRHPAARPWTKFPFAGELTAVGIVSTFAFGIAFLAAGVIDFVQHGVGFVHLALLLAVVGGVILFGRRLTAWTASKASAP